MRAQCLGERNSRRGAESPIEPLADGMRALTNNGTEKERRPRLPPGSGGYRAGRFTMGIKTVSDRAKSLLIALTGVR